MRGVARQGRRGLPLEGLFLGRVRRVGLSNHNLAHRRVLEVLLRQICLRPGESREDRRARTRPGARTATMKNWAGPHGQAGGEGCLGSFDELDAPDLSTRICALLRQGTGHRLGGHVCVRCGHPIARAHAPRRHPCPRHALRSSRPCRSTRAPPAPGPSSSSHCPSPPILFSICLHLKFPN
jgi:hypothetical protein